MPDTAQILVNIFDGARNPLSDVEWTAKITDGQRPLSQQKSQVFPGLRRSSVLFPVTFFDNFFDDYTVQVTPSGFDTSGWFPVRVHATGPAIVDLMTLPKGGDPHFADATWERLKATRPNVAELIERGCDSGKAPVAYGAVLEERPKALACFLNIVTAMAQIQLPSKSSPLSYYWNIAWPKNDTGSAAWLTRVDEVFKQDRFFCYVDAAILPDIREAARQGAFAPEPNPGAFHSDATESYKQTQFDVANIQLTFHGHDTATLPGPDGNPISCVKVEPDIDYFKDLGSHGLLEVIPNLITHGLTEPTMVYMLRWMAGRRAGLNFNPLYTVEP